MTPTKQAMDLLSLTGGTATFEQGAALYSAIAPSIANADAVKVSLHNAPAMSSSFMHGAFGKLIDSFGVEAIRKHLKLTNYLPSHAERIKQYLDTYDTNQNNNGPESGPLLFWAFPSLLISN